MSADPLRPEPDIGPRLAQMAALTSKQLRAEWRRLHRSPPPRHLSRDLLIRALAYRIQEQIQGGLSRATLRKLQTLARTFEEQGAAAFGPVASPRPGAKLVREWHGETHCVLVMEDGFNYRDQRYASLSKIAWLITGAHWSGPRFFGIGRTARPASTANKAADD